MEGDKIQLLVKAWNINIYLELNSNLCLLQLFMEQVQHEIKEKKKKKAILNMESQFQY